jgi:ElaB/YqjD/DUF883 family membrane-anchored ribosome-binding protein
MVGDFRNALLRQITRSPTQRTREVKNMSHTVLEQMSDQLDETAHKASRAVSAVSDALEDGVTAARRAAKHGSDIAVELYDDTKKRIQRNPIETLVAATAIGIATGAAISWVLRRKNSLPQS